MSANLQAHITHVLKTLLNSERNQQKMCDDGFARDMFLHCGAVLTNEQHPLHSSMQFMFELMAAQSLQSNDLRCISQYLLVNQPVYISVHITLSV